MIMMRGRKRLGCGISSARWAGPSRPIRVEKLFISPSRTANPVEEYLVSTWSASWKANAFLLDTNPVLLLVSTKTKLAGAFGALTRSNTEKAMKPIAVAQPLRVSTSHYEKVAAIVVLTANILQRGNSPQPKAVNEPAAHGNNHVCDKKTPSNSHVEARVA